MSSSDDLTGKQEANAYAARSRDNSAFYYTFINDKTLRLPNLHLRTVTVVAELPYNTFYYFRLSVALTLFRVYSSRILKSNHLNNGS